MIWLSVFLKIVNPGKQDFGLMKMVRNGVHLEMLAGTQIWIFRSVTNLLICLKSMIVTNIQNVPVTMLQYHCPEQFEHELWIR